MPAEAGHLTSRAQRRVAPKMNEETTAQSARRLRGAAAATQAPPVARPPASRHRHGLRLSCAARRHLPHSWSVYGVQNIKSPRRTRGEEEGSAQNRLRLVLAPVNAILATSIRLATLILQNSSSSRSAAIGLVRAGLGAALSSPPLGPLPWAPAPSAQAPEAVAEMPAALPGTAVEDPEGAARRPSGGGARGGGSRGSDWPRPATPLAVAGPTRPPCRPPPPARPPMPPLVRPSSGPAVCQEPLRQTLAWSGTAIMFLISWCSAGAGVLNEWLIKRSANVLEALVGVCRKRDASDALRVKRRTLRTKNPSLLRSVDSDVLQA